MFNCVANNDYGSPYQDEPDKPAESQPGESGNDSGISDTGEQTEAVKDVFDLTLDKMDGEECF